jgi:hypothetical protein
MCARVVRHPLSNVGCIYLPRVLMFFSYSTRSGVVLKSWLEVLMSLFGSELRRTQNWTYESFEKVVARGHVWQDYDV